jgi:hypothetical protein
MIKNYGADCGGTDKFCSKKDVGATKGSHLTRLMGKSNLALTENRSQVLTEQGRERNKYVRNLNIEKKGDTDNNYFKNITNIISKNVMMNTDRGHHRVRSNCFGLLRDDKNAAYFRNSSKSKILQKPTLQANPTHILRANHKDLSFNINHNTHHWKGDSSFKENQNQFDQDCLNQ